MKLKLVVASMSVLGLVSCPVFAATQSKHKHHKKHHHEVAAVQYKDYKDLPEICTISQNTMIMDGMEQNMLRSMPNPCNPGWFNRIQLSGGINVDLGKFGNRNQNYMGENYQRFSLNDAYLNLSAVVNEWAKAFASISYETATINSPETTAGGFPVAEYSAAYANNVTGSGANHLELEQAYATIGNFDVSPFFLQLGKQFQDFSRYQIHPITRSLTQVLSETLATSLKVGFIASGFNGSLYVFDDPLTKVGQSTKTTNYGLALGYDAPSDSFGWDIGAAYLYNMIGANDVAYVVNQNELTGNQNGLSSLKIGYRTRVGAAAVYADINSGPFTLGARYTAAVQRFNVNDVAKNGSIFTNGALPANQNGAKPWAAGIQAGFGFEGWGRNQNVYVGYQTSREAAGLLMPKQRYLAGYGINAFGKNTNLGIEWDHDSAFSHGNGGTGNSSNLVTVRAGVQFG